MIIEQFLKNLGLNENEVKVYLYLLTHGESIASIVAKRLTMKRATCYQTLESLESKELVSSFIKNKIAHFDAVEPDDIVDLCEQKVHQMQKLKAHASDLHQEFKKLRTQGKMPQLEIRGKIKYYEGIDAVTDLINETLDEKEKEQLCFGLNTFHTELSGNDWQNYTKKRVHLGMKVKSIQPDIEEAIEYKSRDAKELRQTRLVPHDKFPGKSEINIIGDMLAMFTIGDKTAMGMKMYNKELAQALRSLFKLAWERAKDYDEGKES
ncbi:MAG TPA: helix-turn-helix domain-containing protein [Candidatus Peribacterales bacterium]|nr:helix-turn-helix domain-containing protein [Candidatus Peribacterales bacterium]